MRADVSLLARFLDAVQADPLGATVQHAVEFRHPSWQTTDAYATLEAHGAMTVFFNTDAGGRAVKNAR